MAYRIVVHEDRNPFVRTESFDKHSDLKNMLARTHNGLLDRGYALLDSQEDDGQRAATYGWVKTPDPQPRVHVVVMNE